jgi:hypothetical protein
MKLFEYDITKHPADNLYDLVYFCSESGECSLTKVPTNQIKVFSEILNDRGRQGWELVQISFSRDGAMAFWKRAILETEMEAGSRGSAL